MKIVSVTLWESPFCWRIVLTVWFMITIFLSLQCVALGQEYDLVERLTFQKPIIDVALAYVANGEKEVSYPRIVVLEGEVLWFDVNGRVVCSHKENENTLRFFDPSVSPKGHHLLLITQHELIAKREPKTKKTKKFPDFVQECKLFDATGKVAWHSTLDTVGFESGAELLPAVSDNGNFALINPGSATVALFDSNGFPIRKTKLVEGWDYARTVGGTFSEDGACLACFVSEASDAEKNSIVCVLDTLGNELWRVDSRNVRGVRMSPNGEYVLVVWSACPLSWQENETDVSSQWRNYVSLFGPRGQHMGQYDLEKTGDVHFEFSENNKFAAFVKGKTLQVISCENGRILSTFGLAHRVASLPDPHYGNLSPIQVNADGAVLVAEQGNDGYWLGLFDPLRAENQEQVVKSVRPDSDPRGFFCVTRMSKSDIFYAIRKSTVYQSKRH